MSYGILLQIAGEVVLDNTQGFSSDFTGRVLKRISDGISKNIFKDYLESF